MSGAGTGVHCWNRRIGPLATPRRDGPFFACSAACHRRPGHGAAAGALTHHCIVLYILLSVAGVCGGASLVSSERLALVSAYSATGGASWTNTSGWSSFSNVSVDPCQRWVGVSCAYDPNTAATHVTYVEGGDGALSRVF